jgi:hypothetical protein
MGLRQPPEGGAGGDRADQARGECHAGQGREARWMEPVGRKLHHGDECDADGAADQQPAELSERQGLRACEQRAAGRRDGSARRQYPARTVAVDQHAGRHLDGDVAVEVEGREMAERRGTEREFGGQLAREHRRRHAMKKADEVERRAQAPDRERDGRGRRSRGLHPSRPGAGRAGAAASAHRPFTRP